MPQATTSQPKEARLYRQRLREAGVEDVLFSCRAIRSRCSTTQGTPGCVTAARC